MFSIILSTILVPIIFFIKVTVKAEFSVLNSENVQNVAGIRYYYYFLLKLWPGCYNCVENQYKVDNSCY